MQNRSKTNLLKLLVISITILYQVTVYLWPNVGGIYCSNTTIITPKLTFQTPFAVIGRTDSHNIGPTSPVFVSKSPLIENSPFQIYPPLPKNSIDYMHFCMFSLEKSPNPHTYDDDHKIHSALTATQKTPHATSLPLFTDSSIHAPSKLLPKLPPSIDATGTSQYTHLLLDQSPTRFPASKCAKNRPPLNTNSSFFHFLPTMKPFNPETQVRGVIHINNTNSTAAMIEFKGLTSRIKSLQSADNHDLNAKEVNIGNIPYNLNTITFQVTKTEYSAMKNFAIKLHNNTTLPIHWRIPGKIHYEARVFIQINSSFSERDLHHQQIRDWSLQNHFGYDQIISYQIIQQPDKKHNLLLLKLGYRQPRNLIKAAKLKRQPTINLKHPESSALFYAHKYYYGADLKQLNMVQKENQWVKEIPPPTQQPAKIAEPPKSQKPKTPFHEKSIFSPEEPKESDTEDYDMNEESEEYRNLTLEEQEIALRKKEDRIHTLAKAMIKINAHKK